MLDDRESARADGFDFASGPLQVLISTKADLYIDSWWFMDLAVTEVVATCLRTVLNDEPWEDFGFPKRPRYGSWVQSFRPKWRVEVEKTVLQQMLCVLTAAYVVSGKLPKDSISLSAGMYTSNVDVAAALGFPSREEGASRLKETIEEYVLSSPDQWPEILHAHIRPDLLPDQKLGARLFLGCTQFGTSAKNMIGVLQWKTT
jgi:hypothetical protein